MLAIVFFTGMGSTLQCGVTNVGHTCPTKPTKLSVMLADLPSFSGFAPAQPKKKANPLQDDRSYLLKNMIIVFCSLCKGRRGCYMREMEK